MAAYVFEHFGTCRQFVRHFPRFSSTKCQNSSEIMLTKCLSSGYASDFNHERYNDTKSNNKKSMLALGLTSISLVTAGGLLLCYFQKAAKHKKIKKEKLFFNILPAVYASKPIYTNVSPTIESDRKSRQFNFIADVVERTAPAVVFIDIQGRHPYTGAAMTVSNGSGFIVRSDGLILTNAHVVANRDAVKVKLQDGREFNGKIESIDYVSDLATVRINQKDLPTLQLGSSADLRPGEWVVAMGSPLSLSNTITTGVVSSVRREGHELGLHKNMEYIQTDAPITFGNSGGPLLNLDGEVIGINTMKVTAGISFAIPSDKVKEFLRQSDEFIERNKGSKRAAPARRYLGITMLTLTPSIIMELQQRQRDFPAHVDHGVLIWKIVVGSPAYTTGLQPGDVVTHINDKPMKSAADVYKVLESADKLRMIVLRGQQKIAFSVVPQILE